MEAIVPSVVTRRKRGGDHSGFSVDRRQAGSNPTGEHPFRIVRDTVVAQPSVSMWTIVTVEIEEFHDGSNCFALVHDATSLRRSVEHFWRWHSTICTGRHRDHPTT